MRIGYARVSTLDQNPDLQLEKLREAECEKLVVEKAFGGRADRPELNRVLHEMLRAGDTLVIWKLDRFPPSLKQLIETASDLKARGISLVSLTDAIDTSSPGILSGNNSPQPSFFDMRHASVEKTIAL